MVPVWVRTAGIPLRVSLLPGAKTLAFRARHTNTLRGFPGHFNHLEVGLDLLASDSLRLLCVTCSNKTWKLALQAKWLAGNQLGLANSSVLPPGIQKTSVIQTVQRAWRNRVWYGTATENRGGFVNLGMLWDAVAVSITDLPTDKQAR